MEATRHIREPQQGIFDSVSEHHKERIPLASREISQQAITTTLLSNRTNVNGVGLANTIRSAYQDPEKARAFLSKKSIEQIKDFRSGLISLMLTFTESDRESLKPLLSIVSQAGKEKQIGEVIERHQREGWSLHTYQAQGTPAIVNHYLLFERERKTEKL